MTCEHITVQRQGFLEPGPHYHQMNKGY
jgi:hypothetical protein